MVSYPLRASLVNKPIKGGSSMDRTHKTSLRLNGLSDSSSQAKSAFLADRQVDGAAASALPKSRSLMWVDDRD